MESNLYRFLLSIDAYEYQRKPCFTSRDLIIGASKGPQFATDLKRIRWKSYIESTGGRPEIAPDWYDEVPHYDIEDIADVFNYRFLPHWLEETDDYLYGFKDLEIEEEALKDFRDACYRVIPEVEIDPIRPEEIALRISGSKSKIVGQNKSDQNWKLKDRFNNLDVSRSYRPGLRTVIQVCPEGARDTVILEPEVLHRVQLIDAQVQAILEFSKESVMKKREEDIVQSLDEFFYRTRYYSEKDLEKEGITKPRILLKIMLEVLKDLYPKALAFEFPDFYDSFGVIVDDKLLKPPRGHGLGMANALTTVMQLALHNMILNHQDAAWQEGHYIHFRAINDDSVTGFTSDDDREIYEELEDQVCKSIGLLKKKTKTTRNDTSFRIAERYYSRVKPHLSEKRSHKIRELLLAYCCQDVIQAKSHVHSCLSGHPFEAEFVQELQEYWGYEFFEDEWSYPAIAGGWGSSQLSGVRQDLKELNDLRYNSHVYAAFKASRIQEPRKKFRKKFRLKTYTPPVAFFFSGLTEKAFLNFGSYADLFSRFSKNHIDSDGIYHSLKDWAEERKRVFDFYKNQPAPPFKDFIEEIVSYYNYLDFAPLPFMVERYEAQFGFIEGFPEDIYQSSNPILSWCKANSAYTTIPGLQPNAFAFERKIREGSSAQGRRDLRSSKLLFEETNYVTDSYAYFDSKESEKEFSLSWINPKNMSEYILRVETTGMPILKKKYRSPLIQLRIDIWGRYLSYEEEDLIASLIRLIGHENVRKILKHIHTEESLKRHFPKIVQAWYDHLEPIKEKEEVDSSDSSSESSDEDYDPMLIIREMQSRWGKPKPALTETGFWEWRQDPSKFQEAEKIFAYIDNLLFAQEMSLDTFTHEVGERNIYTYTEILKNLTIPEGLKSFVDRLIKNEEQEILDEEDTFGGLFDFG